jgi:hypothetical protein
MIFFSFQAIYLLLSVHLEFTESIYLFLFWKHLFHSIYIYLFRLLQKRRQIDSGEKHLQTFLPHLRRVFSRTERNVQFTSPENFGIPFYLLLLHLFIDAFIYDYYIWNDLFGDSIILSFHFRELLETLFYSGIVFVRCICLLLFFIFYFQKRYLFPFIYTIFVPFYYLESPICLHLFVLDVFVILEICSFFSYTYYEPISFRRHSSILLIVDILLSF